MKREALIIFVYACILLAGTLFGYFSAKSLPSLISGLVFFPLLSLLAYGIYLGKKSAWKAALALLLLLDAFFTFRYLNSYKFFPSGMMAGLTLATLALFALSLRKQATVK